MLKNIPKIMQSFDEYYLYTGDEEFLKNRAYQFLRGVGKANGCIRTT